MANQKKGTKSQSTEDSTKIIKKELKGLQRMQVVQSNEISRSAQGLSLVEKRILCAALVKSQGFAKPINITAKEYSETFQLNIAVAYQQLITASKTFMKRSFTLPTITGKGKPSKTQFNWLSFIEYADYEGLIRIKFNPDIYPYLFDLTQKFTQYQLSQASALRSIYSWRLLELLESYRNHVPRQKDHNGHILKSVKFENGWLKISIDDFNHAMETPDSYKNSFKDLNRRIIAPAIKELNKNDGWTISCEPIRKGRKIASLNFQFMRDPNKTSVSTSQGDLFNVNTEG